MTSVLRPADASDAQALTHIAHAAYAVYLPRMPEGLRPGPMDTDYAATIERTEVWVVERAGRAIAFLVLVPAADHLLVENVAVDPDAQGEGVGRRLLAFAEDRARAHGLDRIRLFTHAVMVENQRLYARLGYTETRRATEHGFERVFFEKHF